MNDFKQKVIEELSQHLNTREKELRKELLQLKEALMSETKSTAGDKHETGRAMTHLEQEKLSTRLQQLLQQINLLQRINFNSSYDSVKPGCLVNTSQGLYLIAVAYGPLTVENQTCFVLSPVSPIGQLLLGKTIGEIIHFREEEITIQQIF